MRYELADNDMNGLTRLRMVPDQGAPIEARIIADSINDGGSRLTTWVLTYPRFIHAELMTHRVFARNAASSRAIPATKLRERTLASPATPVSWGQNQRGMQADQAVADTDAAKAWWARGLALMAAHHEEGERLGLHKQIVNRVIEPWMMIETIVSGTEFANFFAQRNHPAAEPNFHQLAKLMHRLYHDHLPFYVRAGGWHLPFVVQDELRDKGLPAQELLARSVGRCARVSYLTHDGRRDPQEDVRLHDQLKGTFTSGDPGHFSPFEHQAQALAPIKLPDGLMAHVWVGPFRGWQQYRKTFEREAGPDATERCPRCGTWDHQHVERCMHRLYSETPTREEP